MIQTHKSCCECHYMFMNLINGYEYHCSLSTLLSKLYIYPNEFSGVRVSEDLYFVLQISGRLQNSANSSLSNYLSDQVIQESWNSAQESVRNCCIIL